jgi:hypothetical protein
MEVNVSEQAACSQRTQVDTYHLLDGIFTIILPSPHTFLDTLKKKRRKMFRLLHLQDVQRQELDRLNDCGSAHYQAAFSTTRA